MAKNTRTLLFVLAAALGLVACGEPPPECSRDDDCAAPALCVDGMCRTVERDAGSDAGTDAGTDAGVACPDEDGDGVTRAACGGEDCDDANAAAYPGATELCDPAGVDEDCDPSTFGQRDGDADGQDDAACCNGARCGDDCDDGDPSRYRGATEVCDDEDDDCDGATDEGVLQRFFDDCDGDLFGARASTPVEACAVPSAPPAACAAPGAGWSFSGTDCDDGDPNVNPGEREVNDGVDQNCNGRVDEVYGASGSITSLGGAISGPTLRVLDGRFETTSGACGPTYCVRGGIL